MASEAVMQHVMQYVKTMDIAAMNAVDTVMRAGSANELRKKERIILLEGATVVSLLENNEVIFEKEDLKAKLTESERNNAEMQQQLQGVAVHSNRAIQAVRNGSP